MHESVTLVLVAVVRVGDRWLGSGQVLLPAGIVLRKRRFTWYVYAVYMTYYMISFPSEAMVLSDEEFVQAGIDANAVDQEAKDAGVWMFSGGVDETVEPVRVAADGTVTPGTYPGSRFNGGVMVLNLPDRAAAEDWARRIAVACRCDQEIRELM